MAAAFTYRTDDGPVSGSLRTQQRVMEMSNLKTSAVVNLSRWDVLAVGESPLGTVSPEPSRAVPATLPGH